MIGHYFTVAFRNLARNKLYTVINFVGLTVALVCVLLVSIYVRHELSYDRHFEKADRIYRVGTNVPINDGSIFKVVGTALPLGPALENDFSEVEKSARLSPSNGSFRIGKNTHEDFFYWADPQLFELFEATVVSGDLTTALNRPNTFVMTERAALKYFGTKDAVGQTMVLDRDRIVEVTAIIKSWPATSHLASPMFGSMLTAQDMLGDAAFENWNNTGINRTYILMSQDASIDTLQSALPDLLARNTNTATAPRGFALDLTALTDVYLAEGRVDDIPPKGSAVFIGVAISVVATLLFVAAFNFIILSLSLAQDRAKEMGLRKVHGAGRSSIALQIIVEATVIVCISYCTAIIVVSQFMPTMAIWLNDGLQLSVSRLPVAYNFLESGFPKSIGAIAGFVTVGFLCALLAGALAGVLPATTIARTHTICLLGQNRTALGVRSRIGGFLVLIQFAVTIALIVIGMTVSGQIQHLRTVDLGFDKENLLVVGESGQEATNANHTTLRPELIRLPGVISVSRSDYAPTFGSSRSMYEWRDLTDGDAILAWQNGVTTTLQRWAWRSLLAKISCRE